MVFAADHILMNQVVKDSKLNTLTTGLQCWRAPRALRVQRPPNGGQRDQLTRLLSFPRPPPCPVLEHQGRWAPFSFKGISILGFTL